MKMDGVEVSLGPVRHFPGPALLLLLLLLLQHCQFSTGQFHVNGPVQPVLVMMGEDATFFCYLSPKINAESMEVRFFKNQMGAVVHLYKHGEEPDEEQLQEYRGRTQLVRDNITEGRVALRLERVTPSDSGLYSCGFHSEIYYSETTWVLQVAALGSAPLISVQYSRIWGIWVMCRSRGWYPKPSVQWGDFTLRLSAPEPTVLEDSSGLFYTETSLLLREKPKGNISCSIQNHLLGQEKKSIVEIADEFFQPSSWLGAFITVLACFICAVVLVLLLFKNRGKLLAKLENMEMQSGERPADTQGSDSGRRNSSSQTPHVSCSEKCAL
ncbi:butyrophilin-like protein 3 [Ornithorhynchus anatinus]|uniref:butyrophilin-like protein 3 n=1 Tax=Ornithorhynchus anatinus TaxID=9258 RepID=UPI0010A89815|nr:butyrophilin-like protein 3 [Ornithorhynchus anatinus]XP_028911040.1 butyrophilin-like protein 3 [Ornithorhynchus anatinus]